ncbi:TOBE domain-containing protein [Desulfurella sp.]|uniref:TOBE domain-containing protein n=1 Tax=Desulfurella sp. TaxID=1962857 RepID=UPI0025BEF390|nr:TOBE domain-containing protein [Desulfurella sp.]
MVINEIEGVLENTEFSNGVYFFEVNVKGDTFFVLQLQNGCDKLNTVKLRFRENDVSIAKKTISEISISNIHKAIVKSIENGYLLARIELLYKDHPIYSLITNKSLKKLNIKVNNEVYFLVKAISIEVLCE